MNKRHLLPAIILGIFVILSGCIESSDNHSNTQNEYSVLLAEEDNGSTIEIDIEEKTIIELQSNPTTGYHWEHSNAVGTFTSQDGESIFIEDECYGVEITLFGSGLPIVHSERGILIEPISNEDPPGNCVIEN